MHLPNRTPLPYDTLPQYIHNQKYKYNILNNEIPWLCLSPCEMCLAELGIGQDWRQTTSTNLNIRDSCA